MVTPDNPPSFTEPQPQAEYQADYSGIRTMAWIALGCAIVIALIALFNKSGIGGALDTPRVAPGNPGAPTLDRNYGSLDYVSPSMTLASDLLKWGGFFAVCSLLMSLWHLLRGSNLTRGLLQGLFFGWVIWMLSGIALLLANPSQAMPTPVRTGNYGAKSILMQESQSVVPWNEIVQFALWGFACCALVGFVSRSEPLRRELPEWLPQGMTRAGASTAGFSASKIAPQYVTELDPSRFRFLGFFAMLLFTFFPVVLSLILGDSDGIVYAFTIWLTFPAWIIINPFTEGVDGFQLALFSIWFVIVLLICLAYLRAPGAGKAIMLLCNYMLATLLVWASLPHIAGGGTYLHAGLIFGASLLLALFAGILICIPLAKVRVGGPAPEHTATRIELAPGVVVESYAAFCGNCGQQVHARNGQCLYCGGGVTSI